MTIIRRGALGLALLLLTTTAEAQGEFHGYVACQDCQDLAALPTPAIFGFKMSSGDTRADVIWDEIPAGGSARFAVAPTAAGELYWLPPNWRYMPPIATDLVVGIVTDTGLLMFAAGRIDDRSLGTIALQPTGSYPGALGPLVRRAPAGHAVEWQPVLEVDPGGVGGCRLGAREGRGVIIGYDVYRLPVATHPAPTLRDFVVHGWNGFADVTKVDFDVPDPDGSSGSDLDPADGLTLRNPDGRPDTGDEVLSFEDDDGPDDAWYRVQPVVFGDPTSIDPLRYLGSVQHDLNGDTVLDAIDVDGDGYLEFIDPSGRGLGLTHGGEIATSLRVGRGVPAGERLACAGEPEPSVERDCGNGLDDDSDGGVDCADADCCGSAPCSAVPAAVDRIDVTKSAAGDAIVTWTASPAATAWDVLSGCIAHRGSTGLAGCLWGDRGIASATCFAARVVAPTVADTRTVDVDVHGIYYVVRERTACGFFGAYGTDSFGAERFPGPGDCAP